MITYITNNQTIGEMVADHQSREAGVMVWRGLYRAVGGSMLTVHDTRPDDCRYTLVAEFGAPTC